MSLLLSTQKVLITGASRGIGLAIAKALYDLGANLILAARSFENVGDFVRQERISCYSLDLTHKESLKEFLSQLKEDSHFPTILIHNVGGRLEQDIQPLSYEAFLASMDLNLGVAISLNHHFLPLMQRQKQGYILHISSDSALNGNGAPGYVAAKAGLNAYIKSTARFYAKDNICINGIMPGIIDFPGSAWDKKKESSPKQYLETKARQSLGRFGKLEEITSFITLLLEKKNMLTSGEIFTLNGGGGFMS
ncbi:MAG: SDR family oxidoreductase [Helicobacter sp.]|nr:SDR family oxidoreductase [Helicobacter sp.]